MHQRYITSNGRGRIFALANPRPKRPPGPFPTLLGTTCLGPPQLRRTNGSNGRLGCCKRKPWKHQNQNPNHIPRPKEKQRVQGTLWHVRCVWRETRRRSGSSVVQPPASFGTLQIGPFWHGSAGPHVWCAALILSRSRHWALGGGRRSGACGRSGRKFKGLQGADNGVGNATSVSYLFIRPREAAASRIDIRVGRTNGPTCTSERAARSSHRATWATACHPEKSTARRMPLPNLWPHTLRSSWNSFRSKPTHDAYSRRRPRSSPAGRRRALGKATTPHLTAAGREGQWCA